MTIIEFLNLQSIVLGFVAGLYFCVGSASLSEKRIRYLSTSLFDSNLGFKEFLIALKAEYVSGGVMLCVAFFAQFVANAPIGLIEKTDTVPFSPVVATIVAVVVAVVLGGGLFCYRIAVMKGLTEKLGNV